MEQEKNVNLEFWDSVVSTHMQSHYYDLDGFLKGKSALDSVEVVLSCWNLTAHWPLKGLMYGVENRFKMITLLGLKGVPL